ncbi:hypothetical protein ACFU5O_02630 [Streptomyces sp. NPDC057445]|uniref:hypothetical protein n=1 Tax=Streptomyces sp. NPDC057445 TaxID=3346136 RepID=UPI0036C34DDA
MGAYRRVLAAIGLAGAAALGAAACEPGAGGLSATAVSFTTDTTGTRAFERAGVDVRRLSCTATLDTGPSASSSPRSSSTPRSVATVDCRGESGDGRKITLKGKVTQELGGRCVRGDLTAKAGDRTVFRANVLGDCTASATLAPGPSSGNGAPRPTVTVTVTVTETRTPGK